MIEIKEVANMHAPVSGFLYFMLSLTLITSIANAQEDNYIPQSVENQLRTSEYYEEYIYRITRLFFDSGYHLKELSKKDIEGMERIAEANTRANQASQALRLDLNGDGTLTQEEMDAYLTLTPYGTGNAQNAIRRVSELDLNRDGTITFKEMMKPSRGFEDGARIIDQMKDLLAADPNKDGVLTLDELKALGKEAFDRLDKDKDGTLSSAEKQAVRPLRGYEHIPVKPLAIDKDAELHVVGVYEGANGQNNDSPVQVTLSRPGKEVVLFLTSYRPVIWQINSDKKTAIKQIILSVSADKDSSILLNNKSYDKSVKATVPYPVYQMKGEKFRNFLNYIKKATGRNFLHSFHGDYKAPKKAFVIDGISTDPDLKLKRLATVATDGLPSYSFKGFLNGEVGEFTLSGKRIHSLPLSNVEVVYIHDNKEYYAIDGNNGLLRYDEKGKLLGSIPIKSKFPEFGHVAGITYDPKTKQIVVNSFSGKGYLYSYSLVSKKWSAVELDNIDLQSLEYDAVTDQYVGAQWHYGNSIKFLDRKGKVVKNQPLDLSKFLGLEDVYDPGNSDLPLRVIPEKDHFIFVAGGGRHSPEVIRVYLYDRKSGDVQLTYAVE